LNNTIKYINGWIKAFKELKKMIRGNLRVWRHKIKKKWYWNDKEIIIYSSGEGLSSEQ